MSGVGGGVSARPNEPWTGMPLPMGWEAKYDVVQKRYFFVDHTHKTTSWEDPRYKMWLQQQGQHLPGSAVPSALHTPTSPGYQSNRGSSPSPGHQHRGHGHQTSSTPVRPADQVKDHSRSGTPSRLGSQPRSENRAHSPAQHSSEKRPSTKQAKEPTEQLLNLARAKLQAEFPDSSSSVVQMALESCSFDESRARQLLKSFNTTTAATNGVTSSSAINTTAPSHVVSSQVNSFLSLSSIRNALSTVPAAATESPANGSKTTTSNDQPVSDQPASVSSTTPSDTVTTPCGPMKSRDLAISPHESLAKGPDGSLTHGPDKKLLLSDYVTTTGPQALNRMGPNPEYHVGASGTLPSGPQPSLVSGPAVRLSCRD